jgi:UDP-glucuronate 4-epimerase
MKNILITGAAGFIGYHLSLYLKKMGNFVIGLDNFNSYYLPSLKKDRQKKLLEKNISVIHGDLQDQKLLEEILEEHKITHVVHLAAQAGVRHSLKHPEDYISSNITGFVSLLEALKQKPSIKLVFASSSSVYGLTDSTQFHEQDSTDLPTNLYGATKKANEALAFSYHHLYKIPMVGLRYFTAYGPWGRPDMAYFRFTKNILNNEPIPVFNHGNMRRDFTYIDDIAEGTANALDIDVNFEIFNLGNNKPSSVLEMIEILENLLNKKAIKEMLPFQPGEMQSTCADITKSQKILHYFPKTPLDQGLKEFTTWYTEYSPNLVALS